MSKISDLTGSAGPAARRRSGLSEKPFIGLLALALLMAVCPVRAEDPDDEYLQVFNLIQQADDLDAKSQAAPAKAKYQQAQAALHSFQRSHPDWNAKLVSSRLNYLAEKLAPPPDQPSAAPVAQDTARPVASSSATQVKLLEAGAEPRTALRLHPANGDKQTLTLTLKSSEADMKVVFDASVKRVAEDGTITYTLVLSDLDVGAGTGAAAGAAEAMKGMVDSLKGTSGTSTVSRQGICSAFKAQSGSGNNPLAGMVVDQLQNLLRQLVTPFPEEPVGAGAKWEMKGPIKSQNLTIDNSTTCELVSLEGGRVVVKATTAQSAKNQKIESPLVPGMKTELAKVTAKGTSECTIDLAHVLPITGSAKYHKETVGTITMRGQKQSMNSKEDMEVQFEAK